MSKINQFVRENPIIIVFFISLFVSLVLYKKYVFGDYFFVFLDVGSDTYYSYFPLMYSKHLLFENFSFFNFGWGMGDSILKNIYLLDLFSLPHFFMDKFQILHSLVYIMILKHVLISLFFYCFLSYYNFTKFAKIIASLIIAYSGFIIIWGQHYHFSSVVVYFIVALWSFESWMHKNNFIFFVFSLVYLFIFNLYFSSWFIIFLVFYATLRYIWIFGSQKIIIFILKTLVLGVVALLISSVIVLPSIHILLSSPRVDGNAFSLIDFFNWLPFGFNHLFVTLLRFYSNDLLGVGDQYAIFIPFSNFYEAGNMYSGLLTLLLLPLIFYNKSMKQRIILILTIILFYLFLNNNLFVLSMVGFSKGYDFRYGIFFSIVLIIALCSTITDLQRNKYNKSVLLGSLFFNIVFPSILLYQVYYQHLGWLIQEKILIKFFILNTTLFFIYYFLIIKNINKSKIQLIIIFVVIITIIIYSTDSINKRNSLNKKVVSDKIGYFDSTEKAINYIKNIDDSKIYRIDKRYNSVFLNDAIAQNYFGLDSYNSLNNKGYIDLFFTKFNCYIPHFKHTHVIKFNSNLEYLSSLLATKYVLSSFQENNINLKYLKQIDNIYIYENLLYVPFGTIYTEFINEKDTPKDLFLLENTVYNKLVFKDDNFIPITQLIDENKDEIIVDKLINYTILNQSNISNFIQNSMNSFSLLSDNNDPMITFQLVKKASLEISFKIDSKINSVGQIYFKLDGEQFSENKVIYFNVLKGINDYVFNINTDVNIIRFDPISDVGNISVIDFKIKDLKDEPKKNKLQSMEVVNFSGDSIFGKINAENSGVMLFQIPYDKGWNAYVNGQKVDIKLVDFGLMGIDINKGEYNIELRYIPYLMKEGFFITLFGLTVLIIIYIMRKRHV